MKRLVSELEGDALDAAVAKACGEVLVRSLYDGRLILGWTVDAEIPVPAYSSNWAHGGQIIDLGRIGFVDCGAAWRAGIDFDGTDGSWITAGVVGPAPLVAAMRCFVLSKLGEEVTLP